MVDNDYPVVLPSTNYVRVRRNALGNILEGIDQRSQAWLAECILLSIVNGRGGGVVQSEQPEMSEEEDQDPTKDGPSDFLSTIKTQSKPKEDENGERSAQPPFSPKEAKCLDSAVNLASPPPPPLLVKSYSETSSSSFILTRRNALHSLLENLNANELAKLKQMYLFQITLEQIEENNDQSSSRVMAVAAGKSRQLGSLLPSRYAKLATHV